MDDVEALLRLTHVPGVGAVRIRKLIAHYGTAAAAWQADTASAIAALGAAKGLAEAWQGRWQLQGWQADEQLCHRHGAYLLPYWASNYPRRLLNIADPPILLYVRGRLQALEHNAIAVIGTRHPTPYGLAMAQSFASALAAKGVCIISGMARGIDTAAHYATLQQGTTVAVLGSGLADIYPRDNCKLAEDIVAQGGALISELPMATPPDRKHFPQRNRIVSGLAKALLLIEAPLKSGAMITVEQALAQGRACFAIPGRLDYPSFAGNHRLLQAHLVQLALQPCDILQVLGDLFGALPLAAAAKPAQLALSPEESALLAAFPPGELSSDELCRHLQLPVAQVGYLLMSLTLKDLIREYPGKRYKKVSL